MTSLMSWVRRAGVRRGTSGIAMMVFGFALAGCDEDRTGNADAKTPIAVTASGVEIVEVMRNEATRTVEAVVVAGGEERQVTLVPLLDGPQSYAVRTVLPSIDGGAIELSFGWDEASGATWVRQSVGDDTFELERSVSNGRVHEAYRFNEQSLVLEYADLPADIMSKAVAKYRRGEPMSNVSADVAELVSQFPAFDAFAAQLPTEFTSPSDDAQLLASLLADPVFTEAVLGVRITDNVVSAMCTRFGQCAAVFCRFLPNSVVCGVCASGVLACIFIEWICAMSPNC